MATIGHNSGDIGGIAGDRLRSFIQRVERLEEEKRGIGEDIKEVYAEAKGTGFDTAIMREIVRRRRMDKAALQERETLLELYEDAIAGAQPSLFDGVTTSVAPAPQIDIEEAISNAPANDGASAPVYFEHIETKPGCWTVLHNGSEVYVPMGAEEEASRIADALGDRAAELARNLNPSEVREIVLTFCCPDFGPAFIPPYTAETIQDNAPAAGDEAPKAKRGPKAAEKVEAYFAGYDGAASDLFTEDCPHERGSLRDNWITGLEDAKAGKAPRWNRPTQPAANDDGEPRESTGNMAA